MKDRVFFDTNILLYAYDANEPRKRDVCKKLVENAFDARIDGAISNQVMVELYNALVRKLGVQKREAGIIVRSFNISKAWEKLDYTSATVDRAIIRSEEAGKPFLDMLIAETMLEHGISGILTENTRDFEGVQGIKATNPMTK